MLELINNRVRLKNGSRHWIGLYRCECGTEVEYENHLVNRGRRVSCGCRKHGGSQTRLYRVWRGMKYRCENRRSKWFNHYGGRGILLCPEWHDFRVFRAWATANGYAQGLSIDRTDNNGDYRPANCRWVSNIPQNRNRRSVKINYPISRVIMRLSEAKVAQREIGDVWGVSRRVVSGVVCGRNWREAAG